MYPLIPAIALFFFIRREIPYFMETLLLFFLSNDSSQRMTRTYREIKRQNVVEDELERKVTGREGEKGGLRTTGRAGNLRGDGRECGSENQGKIRPKNYGKNSRTGERRSNEETVSTV